MACQSPQSGPHPLSQPSGLCLFWPGLHSGIPPSDAHMNPYPKLTDLTVTQVCIHRHIMGGVEVLAGMGALSSTFPKGKGHQNAQPALLSSKALGHPSVQ
jgi:hypothetical protein